VEPIMKLFAYWSNFNFDCAYGQRVGTRCGWSR